MDKSKWIWMGHAGHFIAGPQCQFRLNTYVNGYIISTVGELVFNHTADGKFEDIGLHRKYETMVFLAKESGHKCCPYVMMDPMERDSASYNDPGQAYAGHLAMCEKYASLKKGKKP